MLTEEEKKERRKAYDARYYQKIKERHNEYMRIWREEHPNYDADRYTTKQIVRAQCLLRHYQISDKKYNRGECTLTAQWIIDNIFNKPCHYCGETDWRKMGCDRIDNSLPHTPENVVPCCLHCNNKRQKKTYEEFKASL